MFNIFKIKRENEQLKAENEELKRQIEKQEMKNRDLENEKKWLKERFEEGIRKEEKDREKICALSRQMAIIAEMRSWWEEEAARQMERNREMQREVEGWNEWYRESVNQRCQ